MAFGNWDSDAGTWYSDSDPWDGLFETCNAGITLGYAAAPVAAAANTITASITNGFSVTPVAAIAISQTNSIAVSATLTPVANLQVALAATVTNTATLAPVAAATVSITGGVTLDVAASLALWFDGYIAAGITISDGVQGSFAVNDVISENLALYSEALLETGLWGWIDPETGLWIEANSLDPLNSWTPQSGESSTWTEDTSSAATAWVKSDGLS